MTPAETAQYEAELKELDDAEFKKGAELSRPTDYGPLFDALEAESLENLRWYSEEIAFWLRAARQEKDKIKKYLYGENVNDFKDKIEEIHHAIIRRRELKTEFSRIRG